MLLLSCLVVELWSFRWWLCCCLVVIGNGTVDVVVIVCGRIVIGGG